MSYNIALSGYKIEQVVSKFWPHKMASEVNTMVNYFLPGNAVGFIKLQGHTARPSLVSNTRPILNPAPHRLHYFDKVQCRSPDAM
jgi:hypothetical protein